MKNKFADPLTDTLMLNQPETSTNRFTHTLDKEEKKHLANKPKPLLCVYADSAPVGSELLQKSA